MTSHEIKMPPDKSLFDGIIFAHTLFHKMVFRELKDTGLTPGQPKILEFLEKGEGCQQKEVAAACRIEPATVTSLLFYMEKAGLVSRQSKNGDRRSLYVYLTAKGRQMMEKTVEALEETVVEAFAGIEEKQQEFKEILQIIHKNLKSEEFYD